MFVHAFAIMMSGTGHLVQKLGCQLSGGLEVPNKRHSSRLRPR